MSLVLYHAAPSRSSGTLFLLEEAGLPYEIRLLDLKNGETHTPEFLAINPLGKVPTIVHDGAVITEQIAVTIYLGDLAVGKKLAPPPGDPLRGPYLRWVAFYGSSFEPALIDKALKRESGGQAMSPYGSYEAVVRAVSAQLEKGPYWLGETFTAADALWGSALAWTSSFGLIEKTPAMAAYLDRITARPAFARAKEIDARLSA
ncbi:MAG: glutathione S-transferase family protein [Proteobacteria bacterium]|nr:glutathione S-transferase family protein [Pseudomonadota bacterium]